MRASFSRTVPGAGAKRSPSAPRRWFGPPPPRPPTDVDPPRRPPAGSPRSRRRVCRDDNPRNTLLQRTAGLLGSVAHSLSRHPAGVRRHSASRSPRRLGTPEHWPTFSTASTRPRQSVLAPTVAQGSASPSPATVEPASRSGYLPSPDPGPPRGEADYPSFTEKQAPLPASRWSFVSFLELRARGSLLPLDGARRLAGYV